MVKIRVSGYKARNSPGGGVEVRELLEEQGKNLSGLWRTVPFYMIGDRDKFLDPVKAQGVSMSGYIFS